MAESLDDLRDQVEIYRKDAVTPERALKTKNAERDAVLVLYRRGGSTTPPWTSSWTRSSASA